MKVVHCKKEEFDVYIGRPSKWGNPFQIGRDGTREDVIEKYAAWIREQPDLMGSLNELQGKVLGCWCSPEKWNPDQAVRIVVKFLEDHPKGLHHNELYTAVLALEQAFPCEDKNSFLNALVITLGSHSGSGSVITLLSRVSPCVGVTLALIISQGI